MVERAGQLGGKAAAGIGEEAVKEEGEMWDEEALDALFNEIIQYSVINSYVSAITELYIWQLKGKTLQPLQGVKLSVILDSVRCDKDRIQRINFIN